MICLVILIRHVVALIKDAKIILPPDETLKSGINTNKKPAFLPCAKIFYAVQTVKSL